MIKYLIWDQICRMILLQRFSTEPQDQTLQIHPQVEGLSVTRATLSLIPKHKILQYNAWLGRVYIKPSVQTQLINNISGSRSIKLHNQHEHPPYKDSKFSRAFQFTYPFEHHSSSSKSSSSLKGINMALNWNRYHH